MIAILALVLLLLIVAAFYAYNKVIKQNNIVEEAWSIIDVMLQKRYELIIKLVEVVKIYSEHELKVFEEVTKNRVLAAKESSVQYKNTVEPPLNQSLKELLVQVEAYPDLKASDRYLALQKEISKSESDIEKSRRYYNGTVRQFNNLIQVFPMNVFVKMLGYTPKQSFSFSETKS